MATIAMGTAIATPIQSLGLILGLILGRRLVAGSEWASVPGMAEWLGRLSDGGMEFTSAPLRDRPDAPVP